MLDISKTIQAIASHICIEQGTSGIWTYRKYADGTAECWGEIFQTQSSYAPGSFVIGSNQISNYPIAWVSAPILIGIVKRAGSGVGYMSYDYSRTDYANFIVESGNKDPVGTSLNIYCEVFAIGKWK